MIEQLFNILIFINLYWYFMPIIFIPAIYYVCINLFSFPLASNKPHEFVIIAKPEKVSIKKISNRYHPFFQFKKGLYWFGIPCSDVNNYNKYHIYTEGINQNITEISDRRQGKLDDILQTKLTNKQVVGHKVLILKRIKEHFHQHYAITIDPDQKLAAITPTKERQPFKISLFHTLGIYIQEEQEVQEEIESGSGGKLKQYLTAITTETVIKQIKYVQGHAYFSASTAYNLLKRRLKMDFYFMTWIKGSTDPRILAIMILLMAGAAAVVLLSMALKPELPPMPTN